MNDSITIMVQLDAIFLKDSVYQNQDFKDFDTHKSDTYSFVRPFMKEDIKSDKLEEFAKSEEVKDFYVTVGSRGSDDLFITLNKRSESVDVDRERAKAVFEYFYSVMGW